jgi:hypothetical protein
MDFQSLRFQPNRPLLSEITVDRLNSILAEIKRNRPRGERGITVRQAGSETWIGLAASLPSGGGTSTPSTTHPFKVSASANETNVIVTVRPGTINSVLPSNTFTDNALTPLTLALDTIGHVVLTATSDGTQITSAVLSVDVAAPAAQTPVAFSVPTLAKWLLAVVFNSSVYQVVTDNLTVAGVQQFIADRASPAVPGQLPYQPYYVWG